MKFISILFSDELAPLVLNGRKTVTRRALRNQNVRIHPSEGWVGTSTGELKCPYGEPGDILWVRETHFRFGMWKRNGTTKKGNQKWKFVGGTENVKYIDNPPETFRISMDKKQPGVSKWYKRNPRFMPRSMARTFLKVQNRHAEKLHDITEDQAILEGVDDNYLDMHYPGGSIHIANVYAFKQLWERINGTGSWEINPYVWVIAFEKGKLLTPLPGHTEPWLHFDSDVSEAVEANFGQTFEAAAQHEPS